MVPSRSSDGDSKVDKLDGLRYSCYVSTVFSRSPYFDSKVDGFDGRQGLRSLLLYAYGVLLDLR